MASSKESHGLAKRGYLRHILLLFTSISVCVLLLSTGAVTLLFNSLITQTVTHNNEKVLALSQKIEDSLFLEATNNITQLSTSSAIRRLLYTSTIENYSHLADVKNQLIQMSNASSVIDSIYVVYPHLNKVITDYGYFFSYDTFGDKTWLEAATASNNYISWIGEHEIVKLRYADTAKVLSVVSRLPYEISAPEALGYVIINLDAAYIKNYFDQNVDSYSKVILWDENHNIACAALGETEDAVLLQRGYGSIDFSTPSQETQIDGRNIIVTLNESGVVPGWRYAAYSDALTLWEGVRSTYLGIFALACVILVVTLLGVYKGSRVIYRPIETLSRATQGGSENSGNALNRYDELSGIYQSYEEVITENVHIKNTLHSNLSTLVERFYISLLLGYVRSTPETLDYARFLHIEIPNDFRYAVGLVQVAPPQVERIDYELDAYRKITIPNQARHAAQQLGYTCTVVELASGTLAVLLGMPRSEATSRNLFTYFEALFTFVHDRLSASATLCISDPVHDLFQVSQAFQQANTILKYASDYNRQDLLLYEHFRGSENRALDLIAYEKRLTQAIHAGETEIAHQALASLRLDIEARMMPLEQARSIVASIFYIVSASIQETTVALPSETLFLNQADNISDLFEAASECFEEITLKHAQSSQDQLQQTAQRMLSYLQENFQQDIGLNSLSETFLYTPSYINRILKLFTQKTFYELLTDIRIEKAKEYLASSSLPIAKISELVGYTNVQSFIRMFKKNTQMTPGAYRDTLGNP